MGRSSAGILTAQSVLRWQTHQHKNLHKLIEDNSSEMEPRNQIQSIILHFMPIFRLDGWWCHKASLNGTKGRSSALCSYQGVLYLQTKQRRQEFACWKFWIFSLVHSLSNTTEWRTAIMCLTPNQQNKMECQAGKAISSQERNFKAHHLVSREYTIWNITWIAGIKFDFIFFGDNDFRKPIYDKCTWDRLPRVQIKWMWKKKRGQFNF